MVTTCKGLVLLFSSYGGPALPGSILQLRAPHQSRVETLSQRSALLVIMALISLALRTLNIFVRMTWAKTRGLSEFQLLPRAPCHSLARFSVNRRPTDPEAVAYHLADCVTSRRQRCCQTASSRTPHPSATRHCYGGSFQRLCSTTGAP